MCCLQTYGIYANDLEDIQELTFLSTLRQEPAIFINSLYVCAVASIRQSISNNSI